MKPVYFDLLKKWIEEEQEEEKKEKLKQGDKIAICQK